MLHARDTWAHYVARGCFPTVGPWPNFFQSWSLVWTSRDYKKRKTIYPHVTPFNKTCRSLKKNVIPFFNKIKYVLTRLRFFFPPLTQLFLYPLATMGLELTNNNWNFQSWCNFGVSQRIETWFAYIWQMHLKVL